jgi:hypothetical protein
MESHSRTNTRAMLGICVAALVVLLVNWRMMESTRIEEDVHLPEDMPPTLALTTMALGPARSLVANMLWWRAVRMQDDGNYFEAIQLANWITALQPKLVKVWTYQSWNMAFNLTAEMPDSEDRWTWVRSGIELLRDDGLRYNPGDPFIRTEISRIYFQKMSNTTDQHWRHYTLRWAHTMFRYLPYGTSEELNGVVLGPDTLAELRQRDPDAGKLLDEAKAMALDLTQLETLNAPERWSPVQRELVLDPARADALKLIRQYVVKKRLPEDLKLDPEKMQYIDSQYGPFDWRLPQAHAVYWGANEGFSEQEDFEFPVVRQAMAQSFMMGRLVYLSATDFIATNNLEIWANTDEYFHYLLENRPTPSLKSKARDFHQRGAIIFYLHMHEETAREFFEAYKLSLDEGSEKADWSFEKFIAEDAPKVLFADAGGQEKKSLVVGALSQAYTWLALGEPERALGYQRMAKLIYDRNQARYQTRDDLRMEPWDELRRIALDTLLNTPGRLPPRVQQNLLNMTQGGQMVEFPEIQESEIKPLNLGKFHGHSDDDEGDDKPTVYDDEGDDATDERGDDEGE